MKLCSKARKRFKRLPKDVQTFFREIDETLQKDKITLKLGGGFSLYSGGKCGGYFDSVNKVLAVAIGSSNLERILCLLVHEFSHYLQSKDKSSVWHNYKIHNGHSRFFSYLNGQRIYKHRQALSGALEIEADCERRAIKLARRWKKYINLHKYAKQANAYILSYHWMAEKGEWVKKSVYQRKILNRVPSKLLRRYDRVPKLLKEAFDRWL